MSDRRSQIPSRVTVEDLLHMKRTERPPPEFWAGFERELRQKQLAALVERKPWWHGTAAIFNRFAWLRLPVGATAVLAVTLVSIRHYSTSGVSRDGLLGVVAGQKTAFSSRTVAVRAESKPVDSERIVTQSQSIQPRVQTRPTSREADVEASNDLSLSSPQSVDPVKPVEESQDLAGAHGFGELAGLAALQLVAPGDSDPMLVEATAHLGGFEDRSISTLRARRTAEALPTAVAVTEQRRSRLLAALGDAGTYTPEPSAPEHAKRSVIRCLAEDGWDRSMSRLQADANRLSIRF